MGKQIAVAFRRQNPSRMELKKTPKTLQSYNQELFALINRVRDMGIDHPLDLPTVVFCGKQSSGKSSLIEAMSGITLPRAAGTCTRTPVELRMTECDEVWSCHVTTQGVTRNAYKGKSRFSEIVYDAKEVGRVVSEAQSFILGPNEKKKFSTSVVCVDVKGRSLGNLSLIDLPGLIEATESSKDIKYIELVRDLVWSYIKMPSSIIAMVLSCKEDMENQSIKTLALKADPQGHRTLGILTKPDTIEEGCHNQFLHVLKGTRFALKLGYFVVKNPSQAEIEAGLSSEQSLKTEKRFFENTLPWKNVESCRIGSANLARRLGTLLANKIKTQLPELTRRIHKRICDLDRDLERLPPVVRKDSVHTQLLFMICTLEKAIHNSVNAKGRSKNFYKEVETKYSEFIDKINETKPVFCLKDTKSPNETSTNRFTFDEVQEIIKHEQGRELVSNMSFEPIQLLVKDFLKKWENPSEVCMMAVSKQFQILIQETTQRIFSKFPRLHSLINIILRKLLDEKEENAWKSMLSWLASELEFPFTMQRRLFDSIREETEKKLIKEILDLKMEPSKSSLDYEDNVLKEKPRSFEENNRADFITQNAKEVVKVAAAVESYYKVAVARFGDVVTMKIDKLFLRSYAESLREYVTQELGLLRKSGEDLIPLFCEDQAILAAREKGVIQRKELMAAFKEFYPFSSSCKILGKELENWSRSALRNRLKITSNDENLHIEPDTEEDLKKWVKSLTEGKTRSLCSLVKRDRCDKFDATKEGPAGIEPKPSESSERPSTLRVTSNGQEKPKDSRGGSLHGRDGKRNGRQERGPNEGGSGGGSIPPAIFKQNRVSVENFRGGRESKVSRTLDFGLNPKGFDWKKYWKTQSGIVNK